MGGADGLVEEKTNLNALVLLLLTLAMADGGSNVVVCPPDDGNPAVEIPEFPDFGRYPGGQGW